MKIDLHCHSYYSDGVSSPSKIVESAFKKGLDGIAITDHKTARGGPEAIKAARKFGILLVLGEEVETRQGDVLALFLKEEIKIKNRELVEVAREIKKQEGIVVIPHPFHIKVKFRGNLERYKDIIDGIEVFNARWPTISPDQRAYCFAQKHNLAIIGASDAHYCREVGYGYTIAEEAKNLQEFKKAILGRKTRFEGKKAPLRYLIFRPVVWTGLHKCLRKESKYL